jgi:aminopeptidase
LIPAELTTNNRVQRLAQLLVGYCADVIPGDKVGILGNVNAEALMLAILEETLVKGAHPIVRPFLRHEFPSRYRLANDEQLGFLWPVDTWLHDNLDVMFLIHGHNNTRQLSGVPPERFAVAGRADGTLLATRLRRSAAGSLRWTVAPYPTEAKAQEANMSLPDYEDFLYAACKVESPDPIAEWHKLSALNQELIARLAGGRRLSVVAPGTQLNMDIGGRSFVSGDGRTNMPDGEIYSAPVETGSTGHITFNSPLVHEGQVISGIRLEFQHGRVVHATAQSNQARLEALLETDDGARVIGEIGIGTNFAITRLSGSALFDEKIGGTVHIALGASLPGTGGKNASDVHCDLVCDLREHGELLLDDRPILSKGRFRPMRS